MSQMNSLGLSGRRHLLRQDSHAAHVMTQRPLRRIMAFRGRSIDDIVNNPIVKNEVLGYWKVFKQIDRRFEVLDLEQQWNKLGHRV
jgi:hypothetical protein